MRVCRMAWMKYAQYLVVFGNLPAYLLLWEQPTMTSLHYYPITLELWQCGTIQLKDGCSPLPCASLINNVKIGIQLMGHHIIFAPLHIDTLPFGSNQVLQIMDRCLFTTEQPLQFSPTQLQFQFLTNI